MAQDVKERAERLVKLLGLSKENKERIEGALQKLEERGFSTGDAWEFLVELIDHLEFVERRCAGKRMEHSWYAWNWDSHTKTYRRECSTMGCPALDETHDLEAVEPFYKSGSPGNHLWEWWRGREDSPAEPHWFYIRQCSKAECPAEEVACQVKRKEMP